MNPAPTNANANADDWLAANQRHLLAALQRVRLALERAAAARDHAGAEAMQPESAPENFSAVGATEAAGETATEPASALQTLCAAFALSPFERDVLLLCAGRELDASFGPLCAAARGEPSRESPTFSLALAALPGAHWSALTPAAPLRRWRLLELGTGDVLTAAPLRLDERVLHFLTGVEYLDDRLQGLVHRVSAEESLPPTQAALARRIANDWAGASPQRPRPIIQLREGDADDRRAVAAAVSALLGLQLHALRAADLPASATERDALARLWQREAVLSRSALLVEAEDAEPESARGLIPFLETVGGLILVNRREPLPLARRASLRFDVMRPNAAEQRALWDEALGPLGAQLNGQLDRVLAQFHLGARGIRAAGTELALATHPTAGACRRRDDESLTSVSTNAVTHPAASAPVVETATAPALAARLWEICCARTRPRLDDLAQRLRPAAAWDDLVLPEEPRRVLREIAAQVRQRCKVYETWGFAAKGARGLGLSALFAGPSGTGKTMAAEVLAAELHLDLYRIDLSAVVSKYIGETEKNLRRIFDAAEDSGVILLFDEADALFGKRSEVRDSHDRYANVEISYLLQRVEAYRGLAILTTNMKSAVDSAFLRRLRFVVQFPFPDAPQRAEIWRRIFPGATPTENVEPHKLAALNVPGGNIRTLALNAAFLAADEGQPVRMTHLLRAARSECAKLEKPLTEAETKGWV